MEVFRVRVASLAERQRPELGSASNSRLCEPLKCSLLSYVSARGEEIIRTFQHTPATAPCRLRSMRRVSRKSYSANGKPIAPIDAGERTSRELWLGRYVGTADALSDITEAPVMKEGGHEVCCNTPAMGIDFDRLRQPRHSASVSRTDVLPNGSIRFL